MTKHTKESKISHEEIVKEAKDIMDDFMKALEKVDVKDDSFGAERKHMTRKPSKSEYGEDFKDAVLKNAPKKDQDCIIAEKKSW